MNIMMTMPGAFSKLKLPRKWSSLRDVMRAMSGDRCGVAAIEFAVMAPALVMMTICTVDLGMGIYSNMQVQNAAQAGAQYAMAHGFDTNLISSAVSNATGQSGISASPPPVQYCGCATAAGVTNIACGSTCPAGAVYGSYVRVSTQGTYKTILPYPMIANSFTLTAQSNVRVQ
jgi:Flp pilus assembly protein TadG